MSRKGVVRNDMGRAEYALYCAETISLAGCGKDCPKRDSKGRIDICSRCATAVIAALSKALQESRQLRSSKP